ncbi:MAG TPA: alpha/beta fold hydrolase [Pseudomonadales bacterium]|nr:alpha/beta fold hydrolase [Pseudomonadales bacterium]
MTAYADTGGARLAYETHGPADGPPLLLIRGLGTQMSEWPPALIEGLAQRGFHVVVFDNRDCGLSSGSEQDPAEGPAYGLADMADDCVGLLDHLGIGQAHVFGISMGGMIAQTLAIEHPHRLLSLISVMSSTGNPELPRPAPEIMKALLTPAPANKEAAIRQNAENRALFGSPAYPETEEARLAAARRAYERAFRPAGVARQYQAILADGSRVERLRHVNVPTLVVHGADDPLVPPAGGEDTARAIPGARLELIPGMGHNLPAGLVPRFVDLIDAFASEHG